MECIREIIDPGKLRGVIKLPQEIEKSKVEVIVLPFEEPPGQDDLTEKLLAIEELGGLLSDQSKEELDEFEQIISQKNPFRRTPIHRHLY